MIGILCWIVAALAALPALMTAINLCVFRAPKRVTGQRLAVSVIVPARNEEADIGDCVRALLASSDADIEVIVVDDHSTDRTQTIVADLAARDMRVRLYPAPSLPANWSGKQHACRAGAAQARHPILMFMDCDVRVAADGVAAMAGYLAQSKAVLVSGFPRERTRTLGETALIPLIHVVLLGYLPMWAMRQSTQVGLGAGCGQIMLADAAVYRETGGHAMVRNSWHDGLTLPRAFRRRGHLTDIFDATNLAECRMYRGLSETWRGLSKNAREGMATAKALPVWTVLLVGGLVAPFLLLPFAWSSAPGSAAVIALNIAAAGLVVTRLLVALRFRQNLAAVLLLPVGAAMLVLLQWRALMRRPGGPAQVWRGRPQLSP